MNSVKPRTRKAAVLLALVWIVMVVGLIGWLTYAVLTYLATNLA